MQIALTQNSVDGLIRSINAIISTNRYSLSVDDRVLLQDCITTLEEFKKLNDGKSKPKLELLIKIVELMSKFFVAGDALKDLM
jgi:hypothetical protein